jgi:hypothetical protein
MNKNAEALDVTQWIKEFEEQKKEQEERNKQFYERTEENEYVTDTLEKLKKWNESHPSEAKQEAIDFLEGNLTDWNRCPNCVWSLINFGFTVDDIRREAQPNDKWVEQVLQRFGKLFNRM